jgi:TetR/AcrR family tetracycline transcriptional repressor
MAVGGGQGASEGVSASTILDAAYEILEQQGFERLSVRGLAAKLGVAPTSIYWHIGDKQAVLDALVTRVIERLGDVEVHGATPEERIASIGQSLRRTLLERPDLVAFVHRQGRTAALFQPARRVLVDELQAPGLAGPEAALAVRAILSLVIGSVLVDRQVERQPAQRETEAELWTALDVDDPELLEHLVRPVDEQQSFDYTLAILVRAVTKKSMSA